MLEELIEGVSGGARKGLGWESIRILPSTRDIAIKVPLVDDEGYLELAAIDGDFGVELDTAGGTHRAVFERGAEQAVTERLVVDGADGKFCRSVFRLSQV